MSVEPQNPAFAPVDLLSADLELDSSIYEGFAAAIMVKGQPRTVALCREYADAVQLMAVIEKARLLPVEPKESPHYRALEDVIAERLRQVSAEGWTADHDDRHDPTGALAYAAACYAQEAGHQSTAEGRGKTRDPSPLPPFAGWPWDLTWWKPGGGARRNLVKAGALILAEIERIDRAAAKAAATTPTEPPSDAPAIG